MEIFPTTMFDAPHSHLMMELSCFQPHKIPLPYSQFKLLMMESYTVRCGVHGIATDAISPYDEATQFGRDEALHVA